jgi:hypothetical protein
VLVDAEGKIVQDRYGTKLFPETWLIGPDGVIRARFDGARDWASPLTIEVANSLHNPLTCEVTFRKGKAEGPLASLCGEVSPGAD